MALQQTLVRRLAIGLAAGAIATVVNSGLLRAASMAGIETAHGGLLRPTEMLLERVAHLLLPAMRGGHAPLLPISAPWFQTLFHIATGLFLANIGKLDYTPSVDSALGDSTANIDLRAAISTFQFPVLVITGRYDTTIEPVISWDLAHQIPGARLVFMEKSGHFSFYEKPDKFDHEVRLFLK